MFRSAVDEERAAIARDLTPGFTVSDRGSADLPFVFCSPHSGRVYPPAFLAAARLSAHDIRKSEDSFVDELFEPASALGAPLIAARFPRAYLDLNREPYELDPLLFREPLPAFANTRSVRVMSGLGTIARVVADNEAIYRHPLSLAVAYERIARLYRPFHQALDGLLARRQAMFGHAVLVDCHSMPSSPHPGRRVERPDIVLGDRYGRSCHPDLTLAFQSALQAQGFEVALNRPYAGGYITEHYGRPEVAVDAIQIEINRALYMNEQEYVRSRCFVDVQHGLEQALDTVMTVYPRSRAFRRATAAE